MAYRNNKFTNFLDEVIKNKAKEKRKETNECISRLAEMQRYVDLSEEKLNLLMESIKPVLHKGVVIYVELLDVVEAVKGRLISEGINTLVVTGKTSQKERGNVSDTFMKDPKNTAVVISAAGAQSADFQSTNEIFLYNTPKGNKNFAQTIGRICRVGDFDSFNIHEIVVEDTLDEYKQILLSSKKELEQTILNSDTIPMKENIGSFDAQVLRKVRAMYLWKTGKKKKKPTL